MNLSEYILEYVSSGRNRIHRDDLPDNFSDLGNFIESLGYDWNYEFDPQIGKKVYYWIESRWSYSTVETWLYAKNPNSRINGVLFLWLERKGNKISNIMKIRIQKENGKVEEISEEDAVKYLID